MLGTLHPSSSVAFITSQVKVGDVDVEIHLPVEPSLKLPLAVCAWLKSGIDGAVYRDHHAVPHRRVFLTWPTLHHEGSTCVIPAKRSQVLKLTIDSRVNTLVITKIIDSEVIFLLTIEGAVALIVIGDVECFEEVKRFYFSVSI